MRPMLREAAPARPVALAGTALPPAVWARVGDAVRRLALQKTPRQVGRLIATIVPELVDADRAACLFHDAERGTLSCEGNDPARDYEGVAAGSLAGEAALRGLAVTVERVGHDARFAAALDDPQASGEERLHAQPIAGADGGCRAVLIVVRTGRGQPFGAAEVAVLAAFAARAAPLFDALAWDLAAEADAREAAKPGLYRREAVDAYARRARHGDVVRVYSTWVRASYWLLVVVALATLAYLGLAHVDEYASGSAVVLADGRTDVSAGAAGVVDEVLVQPGEPVEAGQVVARLRDPTALAELTTLEAQFEQQVVERLLAPDDPAVEQTLGTLLAQRQRAAQAVERTLVRAPIAGVAGDNLLAPGAPVAYGDPVLSIVSSQGDASMGLVAALPAGMRPLLHAGLHARVELVDHPGEYQELTVSEVSADAFGPAAARRKLGALLGDAVPVAGAVVFVRFELPARGFTIDDRSYPLHHGMLARVEIRMRSERLVTALIPGLKEIFGSDYE